MDGRDGGRGMERLEGWKVGRLEGWKVGTEGEWNDWFYRLIDWSL